MRLLLTASLLLLLFSCSKNNFITSPDASLNISADTLKFDTVFTTIGSITQRFKIRNDNNQKLNLTGITLAGGAASTYQLNINGQATNSATNIALDKNDSLYVFVKLTVTPTVANLPFIVQDSIRIQFNGNTRWVQLQAYGQNARFLRNVKLTANTTWDNQLPYVILGGLTVDTLATLTMNRGVRVYCHADAPIIINGILKVNGEKDTANRVYFRGDRLNAEYKDLPAGWPGIIFSNSSRENVLNYAVVKNAYQGLVAIGGAANALPKLTLNECIVDNAYDVGLKAVNASIKSRNCLFSNCGNDAVAGVGGSNVLLVAGSYLFDHATIATYGNAYQSHKQPALYITNTDGITSAPLTATFRNSIIWGEGGLPEDEIKTAGTSGAAFSVTLQNVLYKVKNDPTATITNPLKNVQPLFDTINTSRRIFDFHLRSGSPAENKGANISVTTDLDGNPRPRPTATNPDLGCYERQ